MTSSISGIGNDTLLAKTVGQNRTKGETFKQTLQEVLGTVDGSIKESEQMIRDFALGEDVELHQVMIAAEEANLALQLTVQVRNKVIEAYQEIMRMQL